jgi:CheY-like chemotaxis protein
MESKLNCILLIDDDSPTNFLNMEVIGEVEGVNHVQIAETGAEALEYISNTGPYVANGTIYPRPDLIFLDINMPGMDGWEFLEEYKKLGSSGKNRAVIIMLTTSLNPDDELKARSTNEVSGFMTKPMTRETFEEVLGRYFRRN